MDHGICPSMNPALQLPKLCATVQQDKNPINRHGFWGPIHWPILHISFFSTIPTSIFHHPPMFFSDAPWSPSKEGFPGETHDWSDGMYTTKPLHCFPRSTHVNPMCWHSKRSRLTEGNGHFAAENLLKVLFQLFFSDLFADIFKNPFLRNWERETVCVSAYGETELPSRPLNATTTSPSAMQLQWLQE